MSASTPKTFLYFQAAEKIKAMIPDEKLTVGSYLPSERKLAEMFGVAFLTIRKALDLLVEDGVIRKLPSRGNLIVKIPAAKNPSGLRRKRIGVTIWAEAGINHPAIQHLLNLSGRQLPADKYEIVIIFINNEMLEKNDWELLLNPDNLDGMLITVQEIPPEIIKRVQLLPIPKVFMGFPGISPGCWSDYTSAFDQLFNYFISLGHRNIAFITGSTKLNTVCQEIEIFRAGCRKHGLPLHENSVVEGDFTEESGYENMLALLRGSIVWDAVLLGDDYMALGALNAIKEAGMSCPRDISIACFEGCFFAGKLSPPVTVLSNHYHEYPPLTRCLEILKDMMEKKADMKKRFFTYRPELIIRGSTAVKHLQK